MSERDAISIGQSVHDALTNYDCYSDGTAGMLARLPEPYQDAIRFVSSDEFCTLLSLARQYRKDKL
jgi:hypothetical protein